MPYLLILLEKIANYVAPLCWSPMKSRLNAMFFRSGPGNAGDLTHQPKAWQKSDQYMEVVIAGHGILWDFIGFHGILWDFMEFYGIVWVCMDFMGFHGFSWDCMVFHGVYGYGILLDFMGFHRISRLMHPWTEKNVIFQFANC